MSPVRAAVEADINAAVAAYDEMVRVVRIDPDRVVVDVARFTAEAFEAGAAVFAHGGEGVQRIDSIRVLRVHDDFVVVEGRCRGAA